ncbi:MAG: suppressor of fused domain protein [Planctomycetota bacterium]
MAAKKTSLQKPGRASRSAAKPPARRRATPPAKAGVGEPGNAQWRRTWAARNKAYAQVFGPAFPKDKVLLADGSLVAPAAASREQLCFIQYPPRPDRLGWIYVTHGLSQACVKSNRPSRIELALHWRERDNKAAVGVLAQVAKYMLETGVPLRSGAVLSSEEVPGLGIVNLRHWLACDPDEAMPAELEQPGGRIRFLLLLGISDAEMQCMLKVPQALADGRQVLLHALQNAGVFPMSDPDRTCLTRRTDFHRLWEKAFQTMREKMANGQEQSTHAQ